MTTGPATAKMRGEVMGIASRILRLCKADLHGVMDQLEDRELLLKQYLREMEEALATTMAQRDHLKARWERVTHDLSLQRDAVQTMEKDIALAVAREKDDIARMLIRRKYPLAQGVVRLVAHRKRLAAEIEAIDATCTRQAGALEQLRQRADVVSRDRRAGHEGSLVDPGANRRPTEPCDEEIELELLQFKEALQAGRSS